MNARDRDYIESRLVAITAPASEAIDRLRAVGRADLADELLGHARVFNDAVRRVRYRLLDEEGA